MSALELKTYEIFKAKFGEAEASTLLEFIATTVNQKVADQKENLASRDDVRKLEKEDIRIENFIKTENLQIDKKWAGDFATLDKRITSEIGRLESAMERNFKDQLKWIIILLIGFASLIITVIKFL